MPPNSLADVIEFEDFFTIDIHVEARGKLADDQQVFAVPTTGALSNVVGMYLTGGADLNIGFKFLGDEVLSPEPLETRVDIYKINFLFYNSYGSIWIDGRHIITKRLVMDEALTLPLPDPSDDKSWSGQNWHVERIWFSPLLDPNCILQETQVDADGKIIYQQKTGILRAQTQQSSATVALQSLTRYTKYICGSCPTCNEYAVDVLFDYDYDLNDCVQTCIELKKYFSESFSKKSKQFQNHSQDVLRTV